MTDVRCIICSKPILDFTQWFEEPCPREEPPDWGHRLPELWLKELLNTKKESLSAITFGERSESHG